jgi:hypothetical protein
MEYEPKQPVYLPTADYLQLDLFLMETRPGVKPDAFVTELVKRWLALEAERLSLRVKMARHCAVFNGKMSSCQKELIYGQATAKPANSPKSSAIKSFLTRVSC